MRKPNINPHSFQFGGQAGHEHIGQFKLNNELIKTRSGVYLKPSFNCVTIQYKPIIIQALSWFTKRLLEPTPACYFFNYLSISKKSTDSVCSYSLQLKFLPLFFFIGKEPKTQSCPPLLPLPIRDEMPGRSLVDRWEKLWNHVENHPTCSHLATCLKRTARQRSKSTRTMHANNGFYLRNYPSQKPFQIHTEPPHGMGMGESSLHQEAQILTCREPIRIT